MAAEVLQHLVPADPSGVLIDATLGEGGHSALFLERYPDLQVVGLDADADALERARQRLARFGDRVQFVHVWFDEFFESLEENVAPSRRPGLILFDLGISSYHLQLSGRGFTFRNDEVLDMRLSPGAGRSAEELVNEVGEKELADLIFEYGEERYARRIAQRIVRERSSRRISTTGALAEAVSAAVPAAYRHGRIHPATRTFQAIRVAVNGELDRISRALPAAICALGQPGRIGVIAFHSLEDRIAKTVFREYSGYYHDGAASGDSAPREFRADRPGSGRSTAARSRAGNLKAGREKPTSRRGDCVLEVLTRKPLRPSESEVRENPASGSARFRVAEKIEECSSQG